MLKTFLFTNLTLRIPTMPPRFHQQEAPTDTPSLPWLPSPWLVHWPPSTGIAFKFTFLPEGSLSETDLIEMERRRPDRNSRPHGAPPVTETSC